MRGSAPDSDAPPQHLGRPPVGTVGVATAGLVVTLLVGLTLTNRPDRPATNLYDAPVEIIYALAYQTTPNPHIPLAEATARWTLRSLSDWEFEFVTGPDAGTVYRLRPDGTMTATDGYTIVDPGPSRHPAGTEMVPLPDLAFNRLAELAVTGGDIPGVYTVDRTGPQVDSILQTVATATGLPVGRLRGVVLTRPNDNDAFRFDLERGDWVGADGVVTETIVVDAASHCVLLHSVEFEGTLVRRVAVVGIRPLG